MLHRPHPPSRELHLAVLSIDGVVKLFAHERPTQLELTQRPLTVGNAREDGEEEVPLHRHRDVFIRALVPDVRQGRALPFEPLDESEVIRPVQPLGSLIRGVLPFGRQRDVTSLHPNELHHHRLLHRRAVLVCLRPVQPLGEGDEATQLKRLGGRQHAPLLVQPLEVLDGERGTLGVRARKHVAQGQILRCVRRVGLEECRILRRRRSVPPAELAPAVPAEETLGHLQVVVGRGHPNRSLGPADPPARHPPVHANELTREGTGNLVVAEGVRRESLSPGHANVRERCPTRGCQPAGGWPGQARVRPGERAADPPVGTAVAAERARRRGVGTEALGDRGLLRLHPCLLRHLLHLHREPGWHPHGGQIARGQCGDLLGGLEPVGAKHGCYLDRVILAAADASARARHERVQ